MVRHLVSLLLITLIPVILCQGCSQETQEERIRSTISEAESAVESGNIRALRNMIAENYNDEKGRTKKDIISYVTYVLLRQKSVYLFVSIDTIDSLSETEAGASVFVAMTGTAVNDASLLPDIRGDIYLFTFRLKLEGDDWLLHSASWQPALVNDILQSSQ